VKKSITLWRLVFIIYLLLLLVFVAIKWSGNIYSLKERIASISVNREMGYWNFNLIPLRSVGQYFANILDDYAYKNILGNILPFMPLGFLLPLLTKRKIIFLRIIGYCFLVVVLIEVFQLVTMLGYFDIDDIWLNMSGGMVGYLAYVICKNSNKTPNQGRAITNVK